MTRLATSACRTSEGSAAPLWRPWTITERVDDDLEVDGLKLRRVGLTAEHADRWVATGAAVALDGSASERAWYELLERAALMEAIAVRGNAFAVRARDGRAHGLAAGGRVFGVSGDPARWQPARSNGVALGRDWADACERALLELAERDRILRSWHGLGPSPVGVSLPPGLLATRRSYRWRSHRLPPTPGWGAGVEVAFVVGYPRVPHAPLVRGSAGARTFDVALSRAASECLQGLAFLWGEELPSVAPSPSPSPMFHLEHYLWPGAHEALRGWLECEPTEPLELDRRRAAQPDFVDLTPAGAAGFRVAKARCADALELRFGDAPAPVGATVSRGPHPIA